MPRLPSALKSGRLISALLGACCNTAFGIIGLYNPSFSLRIVAGAFGAVGIFLTLIPAYLDATKPSPHLSPSKSSSDLEMGYKDRGITDASDEALHHSAEPISRSTSLSPGMASPSRHRLERYTDTPEPTSPVSNASEVSTGNGESSDEADTEPLVHTQSTPPVSLNTASIFRPDLLSPELNGAPRSELNQLATKYNLDVKYSEGEPAAGNPAAWKVDLRVNDQLIGTGTALKKKDAKDLAAKQAVAVIKEQHFFLGITGRLPPEAILSMHNPGSSSSSNSSV